MMIIRFSLFGKLQKKEKDNMCAKNEHILQHL